MNDTILIVGLGNPDKKYKDTRHNCGFMAIDYFAKQHNLELVTNDFFALYTKTKLFNKNVILAKPMTYMNNSGIAVSQIKNYFKIDVNNILIIEDDLDLPIGEIKAKPKGESGGHNGLKSIFEYLNTSEIKRIKIGIGKPEYDVIDYVLSKFTNEEKELIQQAIKKINDGLEIYLKDNFDICMTKINN